MKGIWQPHNLFNFWTDNGPTKRHRWNAQLGPTLPSAVKRKAINLDGGGTMDQRIEASQTGSKKAQSIEFILHCQQIKKWEHIKDHQRSSWNMLEHQTELQELEPCSLSR